MDDSEDTLTAGTLIDAARMFAAAADAVNDKFPNSLHVLSHLLNTSIELALKAYLRHSGYSEKQLMQIGHNLGKLLDHAVKHGIEWTGSRSFVLKVAGHNYRKRLFVYPEEGVMTVIMPWRLRQIVDELINYSFIAIKGKEMFETHKTDPGLSIQSEYPNDLDASGWTEPALRSEKT
ncbi:MAG: hypothetical protein IT362_11180 [Deltaproteobacteria bacterium]|nr:hypothetical protein [Deltaproteobacteria bacterium]